MMKQRRKLFGILSMLLALALLLTGCTTGVGNGTTTAATKLSLSDIGEDASLSIYILTSGITGYNCHLSAVYDFYADYKNMIDISIEEFTNADEMESRLQMELAAGQGPDVIMADVVFGLDMMSLAKNGAFYDLTDIIAADETFNNEKYYTAVMKAGQINDCQYVIPLTFTLPTFVSTTTALNEMGINPETDTTIEVYEKMLAHLKSADTPQVSTYGGYADTILALMQSCGKKPISYEMDEVDLNGEEEQMLIELGAELYKHRRQWADETVLSANPPMEMVEAPIIYSNLFTSPFQLQLYYSGYAANDLDDEVEFFFAPDEDGNHYALVQEFAAVNANADNPELAWLLFKAIIDDNPVRDVSTALSLNRNVTSGYVHLAMSQTTTLNGTFKLKPISQELGTQLLDACETIVSAGIYQDSPQTKIFTEAMSEYINDEITFDTMISDIQNKVKLYINE